MYVTKVNEALVSMQIKAAEEKEEEAVVEITHMLSVFIPAWSPMMGHQPAGLSVLFLSPTDT